MDIRTINVEDREAIFMIDCTDVLDHTTVLLNQLSQGNKAGICLKLTLSSLGDTSSSSESNLIKQLNFFITHNDKDAVVEVVDELTTLSGLLDTQCRKYLKSIGISDIRPIYLDMFYNDGYAVMFVLPHATNTTAD